MWVSPLQQEQRCNRGSSTIVPQAEGDKTVIISLGKVLKGFINISVEDFLDKAIEQYGRRDDADITWPRIEPVARTLVESFKMTLDDSRFAVLVPRLDAIEAELRGFAYEGAGMGLMLLDSLFPWKNRLKAFADGPAASYLPLLYIGAGVVLPRVPRHPERFLARLDPFLRWLAIDGYGFYEGFFSWQRATKEKVIPAHLSGYARRAYDQGLGRSLWFATGVGVDCMHTAITAFPLERQADLWSGVGFACAYAGGADRAVIGSLQAAAGQHCSQLAVGAAVATTFRQQAGNVASHTNLACEVFWSLSSNMVAHMAHAARKDLPSDRVEPAYELWRQRLAAKFAEGVEKEYQQKETR
jgi:hypothetical protein